MPPWGFTVLVPFSHGGCFSEEVWYGAKLRKCVSLRDPLPTLSFVQSGLNEAFFISGQSKLTQKSETFFCGFFSLSIICSAKLSV